MIFGQRPIFKTFCPNEANMLSKLSSIRLMHYNCAIEKSILLPGTKISSFDKKIKMFIVQS